ncbi:helix-turn-helix domain-containing protein [Nonomuraea rubra]
MHAYTESGSGGGQVGRKPTIDREELARRVAEGMSVQELAAHFGVSESGVLQAKRAAGLARPMLDHSAALPWKLAREHAQSGPATNLRNLSAAAQGKPPAAERLNTALRWAQRLVDAGLDVRYDAAGGFTEVPAAPQGSHVASVLAAARKALDAR